MLFIGTIVIAGGGVLAYNTIAGLSDRVSVVVMSRDVSVGQLISATDVTTTMVGLDDVVATVPGRELSRVVGMRAASDLMTGMLVQRRQVTDHLIPAGDQQLVPVAVKPSRLPARGLASGDLVLVVPAPTGAPTAPPAESPEIEAVVDQVKGLEAEGLVVVDLIVKSAYGPALAALASDGDVVLVLNPRRP